MKQDEDNCDNDMEDAVDLQSIHPLIKLLVYTIAAIGVLTLVVVLKIAIEGGAE